MTPRAMNAPSAWEALEGVNLPGGYRVEITDGKIILTPRNEEQSDVVIDAAPQIDQQLADRGKILSQVAIDFPSHLYGYAPDLAIVAPGSERNSRGCFEWHSLEAILEIVSLSTRDNDFDKKFRIYAECAIPLYVIIDPSDNTCTVHSRPTRRGTYDEQEQIAFGEDLILPLEGREIVVKTDGFPRSES
ncbi:Uma2 family endonuclease [Streptomyces sp. WAC01280]|uniref:Uma2 family endonuclease n=1 Tax=Streptomyces sp. WAC01280 TaxID=2487424 RepID=UPI000F771CC7|nr:Uma2 family endonuclease [Streptomyces sp. WAC01280]RSS50958.1 Uma2 family endonuclease [Streptomyces sp. WAC01280]